MEGERCTSSRRTPAWTPSTWPSVSAAFLERGQGTVEYVGLILLVSMLMVGMVAAMKGFNATSGTEIAEVIIAKIESRP